MMDPISVTLISFGSIGTITVFVIWASERVRKGEEKKEIPYMKNVSDNAIVINYEPSLWHLVDDVENKQLLFTRKTPFNNKQNQLSTKERKD